MTVNEKLQETMDRVIYRFQTGDLPEALARTAIRRYSGDLDMPSDNWSLLNQFLMIISGTDDARGFNQWKAVGRSVKKGAKAIYITAPCQKKITTINNEGEEESEFINVGFRGIPVFRYEDTEGEPLEHPDYTPKQLPPLIDVAKEYGVDVRYAPKTSSFAGWYSFGSNNITLCSHDEEVFFHELVHAVHNTFEPLRGGQDSRQEIIAEFGAAVLCEIYGYEGYIPNCQKYIEGYAREEAGKAALKVLGTVSKVLEAIFKHTTMPEAETLVAA